MRLCRWTGRTRRWGNGGRGRCLSRDGRPGGRRQQGLPHSRRFLGQLDDDVARADHPQLFPGQPLERAGIAPQPLDLAAQPLDLPFGLLDARLEELLAGAGGFEVAVALEAGDREESDEKADGGAQHRAERVVPGRVGFAHEVQREKAAAPG